jgi:iron complex outermembrane recepter protein
MNVTIKRFLLTATVLASGALANPDTALAQTSAGPNATAGSASQGLEEIVVTARKREERLQTVPIAVTALTGTRLDKEEVRGILDLQSLAPSLNVELLTNRDDGGLAVIRGLPSAGYFAEIPTANTGVIGTYYDLSSVQVLNGPQGTLFGINSIGGAILFEPKHPVNDFEGYAKITLGNYNERGFEGAINVPIVEDKLLVRFSGIGELRDGFTTVATGPHAGLDLDNRDYFGWRLGVTWRPTDDIENYLLYWGVNVSDHDSSLILANLDPGFAFGSIAGIPLTLADGPNYSGLLNPNTQIATYLAGLKAGAFSLYPQMKSIFAQQQAFGPREVYGLGGLAENKIYYWTVSDIAKWDISDDFSIRNLASYSEYGEQTPIDFTNTGLSILETTGPSPPTPAQRAVSDEIQLHGKALSEKLNWVVGSFLAYSGSTGGLGEGTVLEFGTPLTNLKGNSSRTQRLFAQADYDLSDFVEGLRFTAGYSYSWNWQSTTSVVVGGPTAALDHQFHAPGWTLDLDYQITPQTMVYVRGAKAYSSGLFNTGFAQTDPRAFVQPEYYTEAEIGVKSDWTLAGMKARTNVAAWHGTFDNAQEAVAITLQNPTRTVEAYTNAATATFEGIAFEGTLIPFERLEITGSYQYIHANYDTFLLPNPNGFGPPIDASNRPLTQIPKNKFSVSGTYQLPVDDSIGKVSATASYSWQGQQYASADQEPGSIIPSYGTLNVRMDWKDIYGYPVDLGFFMNNALDSTYVTALFPLYFSTGFNSEIYAPPRTWGFELKYHFGGPAEPEATPAAYTPPPVVAPAPSVPHSYLVFFDFNKSDLTSQAVSIVNQAAANAGPAKVTQLTVTGHTDTVGSDAYNMRLSRRRAESVAAQLEKDGIASSEIEIVAKGKRDLLVPTADGVKEPQNRRVQIVYDGGAGA